MSEESSVVTATAEIQLARAMGSLEAQVRELIHDNNARTQRDEAVARSLAKLEDIPKQLEGIKDEFKEFSEKMDKRLQALEVDHIQRKQTVNLGLALMKSRAVGWIVGILLAAGGYLYGKYPHG